MSLLVFEILVVDTYSLLNAHLRLDQFMKLPLGILFILSWRIIVPVTTCNSIFISDLVIGYAGLSWQIHQE